MSTLVSAAGWKWLPRQQLARQPVAAAVAAALCQQSMPVFAADPVALDEIVVSATRREESIQNTPYNLAAVSSTTIEELHMTKIDDVAHWVPGVAVQDQGAYGSSNVVFRGLNVSSLGASSGGPNGVGGAVAEYLGETPLYFDFKLLDIDRVETLLGPQGTLYGTGTLGGVVRYVPKKPNLTRFEGEVHARLSAMQHDSQGSYDGDATLNLPLIDGTLGLRATVGYFHDAGFIDNTRLLRVPGVSLPQPDLSDPVAVATNLRTARGVDFDHTFTGRLSLLFKPNDVLQTELIYAHQRTNTDGTETTHVPLYGTGKFDNATRVLQTAEREADLVGLVLTAHLGFADLVSSSSYAERKIRRVGDTTDAYLGYSYTEFPQFVSYSVEDLNRTLYAEELRMVSNGEGRLKWLAGLYYEHHTDQDKTLEYMPGYPAFAGIDRPDALDSYTDQNAPFTTKAVFGELGYQFTPAWQATVGGRWFTDQISSSTASASPLADGSPPNGLDLVVLNVSGRPVSRSIYKVNTSYRFTPDLMFYATVSEGYRAGGINSFPVCTNPLTTHQCLLPDELAWKPDTTRNHELGMRSTWFDKRLTLNGAIYYITWQDLRVQGISQFGQTFLKNGSSAISKGFEMQFDARPLQSLQVLGSYSYNDARMSADAVGLLRDINGKVNALDGDRLPGSPQQMGSIHIRYSWSLASGFNMDASYGVTAQSNFYSKIGLRASGEKLPGYALHDASIGVSRRNWNASLYVANLLNKYAFTGADSDFSFSRTVDGLVSREYDHSVLRPRQVSLEVRATF